ncbi:MAG: SIMPL domain-containing protein [Neisseriaceae bacterium]|nr:SIMPL domain-containing protein [Neisseriaceae bacterium]
MLKKYSFFPLVSALLFATPLWADNLNYGVVSFSATATETVKQDTMNATLSIRESGGDRQKVSNAVTERSNRVLAALKKYSDLNGALTARRTYPVYDNNRKNPVWHDMADITVKSTDFAAMSRFLAAVQNDAAIGNLHFSVSDSVQHKTLEKLLTQAIGNFKQQAQVITNAMGGKAYKIVQMDLNGGNVMIYRNAVRSAAMMTKSADAVEMNIEEAGDSEIRLDISGSIQVQ